MRPWNPPLLWPRGAAPWHRGTVAVPKRATTVTLVSEVQSGQWHLAGCELLQVDSSNFRHLG